MGNKKPLHSANKIIIRLPNFLGDSIMATPAIRLLLENYPNASLTLVCKAPIKDVFKKLPNLERVIIDDTKNGGNRIFKAIRLIKEIRKNKYELGILFQNSLANAIIFRFCRIRNLVGYKNDLRGILLDSSFVLDRNIHYINRFAGLVNNYLNNKFKKLPALRVWNGGEVKKWDFDNNLPVIALSLGNDAQMNRAYPQKLSWELIQQLVKSRRYNLVFVGDAKDAERNNEYESNLSVEDKKYVRNYSGKTDVDTHINLIKAADALITVDSSGMHIAAACNIPFIVLLGRSTSPFCTVQPKVDFGRFLKNENSLIEVDKFISQISPTQIIHELSLIVHKQKEEVLP
ncbi:glycosyltransferase family 9 protein [Marinifilum caeruleilacunae]|uniref:Glycosyltransferase family 9 protein n=1 Tax=Marinifilum caeruleilacunae TaxID=2499076 RepID=A0ABX1WXC6_9BACT|nr:glycosyltransferase family 9 protein [Marinifilum caeruleilacunae]NOU60651.1 glycosyltransferase family 9 protein [Marinifilum caeruleilacunae]